MKQFIAETSTEITGNSIIYKVDIMYNAVKLNIAPADIILWFEFLFTGYNF